MTREEAIKLFEYIKNHPTIDDEIVPIVQDAFQLAIEALSEPTKTEPTTITENMTNGDVIKATFPTTKVVKRNEYLIFVEGIDEDSAIISFFVKWWNAPYKGDFTTPTRPKAKWIKVDEHLYECSCCGYNYRNYDGQVMKFCMNCGAVMEGGE